jgi:hypothetical protein
VTQTSGVTSDIKAAITLGSNRRLGFWTYEETKT